MIRLYCGKKLRSRTIPSPERPEIPRGNAIIDKKLLIACNKSSYTEKKCQNPAKFPAKRLLSDSLPQPFNCRIIAFPLAQKQLLHFLQQLPNA